MMIKTHEQDVTKLVPLFKARRILGVSWPRLMQMVRTGAFAVYNISDKPMSLDDVEEDGSGLRVKATDLEDYIDSRRI